MYKQDLGLNNLQGLICYKTQLTNQPNRYYTIIPGQIRLGSNGNEVVLHIP